MDDFDYYEILGVKPTATLNKITKGFRNKTREYHPDRQTNDNDIENAREISSKINKAYQILSDNQTRLEYDIKMGYKKSDKNNISKLNEYKQIDSQNVNENINELANKSRNIESKITVKTVNNKSYDNAGLIITKAKYGYLKYINNDDIKQNYDTYYIDVTNAVQCLVEHRGNDGGFIMINDGFDKCKILGFYDPNINLTNKHKKYLEIEYKFNTKYHYISVENYEYILIPKQEHLIKFMDETDTNANSNNQNYTNNNNSTNNYDNNYDVKRSSQIFGSSSTSLNMYYKNDGTKPKSKSGVDIKTISWLSKQRKEPTNNDGNIVEINGKRGIQNRNSLANLPKYEDIISNNNYNTSNNNTFNNNTKYQQNTYNSSIKVTIGLVVIGCVGVSLYFVNKRMKQNRD